MHRLGEFPNFYLPIGRGFGAEIPVTKRRKPAGSVWMTGQFKPMTPALEKEIVRLLADMLVTAYKAEQQKRMEVATQPPLTSPSQSTEAPGTLGASQRTGRKPRRRRERERPGPSQSLDG
jgi:hypothetical protein